MADRVNSDDKDMYFPEGLENCPICLGIAFVKTYVVIKTTPAIEIAMDYHINDVGDLVFYTDKDEAEQELIEISRKRPNEEYILFESMARCAPMGNTNHLKLEKI